MFIYVKVSKPSSMTIQFTDVPFLKKTYVLCIIYERSWKDFEGVEMAWKKSKSGKVWQIDRRQTEWLTMLIL